MDPSAPQSLERPHARVMAGARGRIRGVFARVPDLSTLGHVTVAR